MDAILKRAATETAEFLRSFRAVTLDALQEPMLISSTHPESWIQQQRTQSNGGACYTISYVVKNYGVPLEIRYNTQFAYIRFIIKSTDEIEGFNTFGSQVDIIYAERVIPNSTPSDILPLLEELLLSKI